MLSQIDNDKKAQYQVLQSLVQLDEEPVIESSLIEPINTVNEDQINSIYSTYFDKVTVSLKSNVTMQKQYWLPDINLDYFQGSNKGLSQSLNGFQVGIGLPIFFSANKAKIKVAQLELQSWEMEIKNEEKKIDKYFSQKKNELAKHQEAINYYHQFGKKLSEEIIKAGDRSFKQGEIDFFQYIQSLENGTIIQVEYLDNVLQFNKIQLDIQYLNY